ncbi:FISUMP domain-containing protein [Roseivirga echinicomitans]
MKIRQIVFALAFIAPLVTLPIEGFFNAPTEFVALSPEINNEWTPGAEWVDWRNGMSYSTSLFDQTVWMTANFSGISNQMSYQEAETAAPEGWRLPTSEEWNELLTTAGFSSDPNQIIPEAYYLFNFESKGYHDPLMGAIGVNEVGYFWVKSTDKEIGNYISVPNRELKYNRGKTSTAAKMAVRYVKD